MSHIIRINNNKIQITDLLKRFLIFEDDYKLTPSRYMQEMEMSVEKRLKLLNDRSRKQRMGRQNKLWAIPDIVVFQNFDTHVKYSTTISFMHQKQSPVRIKMIADLSPCFILKELPGTVYSKLAPGTPHKMTLDFYSEEHNDFSSFIRFEADDDVIYLPIVAIAPRPIIISPDVIELSETVVNIVSDKKVFMRNLGKSPVVFKLKAESPFSVCPRTGIMEPNEVLDIKISYKTFRVEKNISELVISFEGVDLYATLICEAKNCEIYLDKTILHFEDMFLGLQRCISMKLVNKSDHTMKYQWKKFQTKDMDIEESRKFRLKLKDINTFEVLRNIQEENPNITDADLHTTFLHRIYEDELAEFDSTDQFLFQDTNFKFPDTSGVVGPHSKVNIEVVFCPTSAERYESVAYLDVSGRETRQPLKMIGTGLGPDICLNFQVLDVESLYLCAKHQYEIVAKNQGDIPGTLTYCHKNMDFGGSMSCFPSEIFLLPGKCDRMVLEFSSTVQGKFLENLNFRIAESGEHIGCVFQGNVECPLLCYEIQEIDFGIVAFGFAVEKEISIRNTTEVPIEFRICVLNDGTYEAITWVNFSRTHDTRSISQSPKEFSIYPDKATVAGYSSITIKITLVPNKSRKLSTYLHTYMWGSTKHYVELPIHYDCMVPMVECSPPKLDIRYCFINSPYERDFTIKNISEVPGYIIYNETNEDDGLSCTLSLTESYIEPGEEITIYLEIKGLQLGLHTKNLNFTVFGRAGTNLCKLTCDVQGPVICVKPEEIIFGNVPLLKWHSRKLNVINDSPVSADISICVANSTFHINPREFKLEPSEKLEVDISIYLTNMKKYSSTLILNIANSMDPLRVRVSALGVGSCILFEPILAPIYDLGTLMTHNIFKIPFKMTNMGKDVQKLYFSRVKEMKYIKDDTPTIKGFPFIIEPNQLEFQEQEQKTGHIEAYQTIPGQAELTYYCYSIDKKNKFNEIAVVKIVAHFEDPVLRFSKSSLHFRKDVTVDKTDSHLQEIFSVANESSLASEIYVTLKPPFYLLEENGERTSRLNANLDDISDFSFNVEFVPPEGVNTCLASNGIMKIGFKMHPKIFSIPLTAEVNYPTLYMYPQSISNLQIAPMSHCSNEVIMKNISPLPLTYRFEWEVASYSIEELTTPRNYPSCGETLMTSRQSDDIQTASFTVKEEKTKQILEHIVNSEDINHSNLPPLNSIFEVLLENPKSPYLDSETRKKLLCATSDFLLPIIQRDFNPEQDPIKIFEEISERQPEINEAMLNITPYQGCMEPFECGLVNIYMRPPVKSLLKATVKCRILGGADKEIKISALSDYISYDIDRLEVFFGEQLFSAVLEDQVNLTNTGHVGFQFAVLDDTIIARPKVSTETAKGLLSVTPKIGNLQPNETTPLHLKYFPGLTGDFNETFLIEIGYLSPISVVVRGTTLYSQLYLMLPRPSLSEAAGLYASYTAIGNLSKDPSYRHYDMKQVYMKNKLDEMTTWILEKEDWDIIEYDDENIPSLVDINMAIERMIGYEFLQNNSELFEDRFSTHKKYFSIPNYIVPTYELFFGNVRRGGHYEQNITLYSYGPGMCIIKLLIKDRKHLQNIGFTINLENTKIKLKEFTNLCIKFEPEAKNVDSTVQHIAELIYIEVYHGARIPVRISASVGVPTTELSEQCVDFCGVVVGHCKRRILCLFNVGFVDAKWSCSLDAPSFFIRNKEGLLAAGESVELHVYFEPKKKGTSQGIMTIHVEGNSEDLIAYLNGFGCEPSLIIEDRIVQFPPVLQYSPPFEKTFVLQNASNFPTEIFFSDYDRQISVHDRICNVFWRENNAKKVYITNSLFRNTSSDIYRYLHKELLLDRLRREKRFTELMILSKTDIRESSDSMERLVEALELNVDSSFESRKSAQDIFLNPDMEDDKRTTIIVFYGNKYTEYSKAANDTSKMLQIPNFTLDSMIIDMLAENKTAFTKEVNQIIDRAYLMSITEEDCTCRENDIEDATEQIWRKLDAIMSSKQTNDVKNMQKKEGKDKYEQERQRAEKISGSSIKISKKPLSTCMANTFHGIPEEMIIQMLSDKIDQIDKMILDGLESIFLPNVQHALRCLLKATKDICCVYFVFFRCTFEEHTASINEKNFENVAMEENRIKYLRKKLSELDDEVPLAVEEQNILIEIQEERRQKSNQKRIELRARIQDELTQQNNNEKATELQSLWSNIDNSYFRVSPNAKSTARSTKSPDSPVHNSPSELTRVARGTKDSKSVLKEKKEKVELKNDPKQIDALYFNEFDTNLIEMIFLLEHWNKKDLDVKTNLPKIGSILALNKKDAKSTTKLSMKKSSRLISRSGLSLGYTGNIDKNETAIKTSSDTDIGYPVWLLNRAHKGRSQNVVKPIMDLLREMIKINCSSPSKRIRNGNEVVYTVLTKPSLRIPKEKLDVFDIVKCETKGEEFKTEDQPTTIQVNDDEIQTSRNSSIALSNTLKKKYKQKRKLISTPRQSEIDETSNVPMRFVLDTGQIQQITVLFKPLYCGSFKYSYNFEVVGTKHVAKVMVQGSCDYPRIDTTPCTLFPHHVEKIDSKTMFLNGVYVISQETLDFGTILLIPNHLLEMKVPISMVNISTMTCYLTFSNKNGTNIFRCDEEQKILEIRPGRQHVLEIYAKPPAEGLFKETLLVAISNNPRVQEINLSCFGCPLKFEVTPKNVNFNKVILGKTEYEIIVLKNHTPVVVHFEFDTDIVSEFRVSTVNGYLEPCSSYEVTVTFIPVEIGDKKESLVLKIFDKEKQYPEPILTEILTLSAEVVTFPLQYTSNINLGLVKGKLPHFFPFKITNTGKYDVKILLTKQYRDGKSIELGDCFIMKHKEYVVEGNSEHSNTCKFVCDEELSFVDYPIVHVTILDNYRGSVIDHFSLKVSARVALSKFEICPYGEYFFGYQTVHTTRSTFLTLKNVGSFEFKYTVMTPKMIEEQSPKKSSKRVVQSEDPLPSIEYRQVTEKNLEKLTRSTTDSKKGKVKTKRESVVNMLPAISTGTFTITPSNGAVLPGESISITIASRPIESEKYSEAIIVFVSEPNVADRKGRRLNLHVEGTEPCIDFSDHKFMFPQQYVVDDIDDLPYIGENVVFEASSRTLHFGKVALHSSVSTKFRLPNTGHVTATVYFEIKEKECGFTIGSNEIDIAPYKFEFNSIEFAPKTIGIWKASLEFECSGGHSLKYSINLTGEACMPTIEIIEPHFLRDEGIYQLSFGPIPIESTCEKSVVLRNSGRVPCKVIVDIIGDPQWFLSFSLHTEYGGAEDSTNCVEKHGDVMALKVGEKGYVSVKFQPKSAEFLDALLKIIVVDNCFDIWQLQLKAFAFAAPVCLDGLPVNLFRDEIVTYSLNFGPVVKNELHKLQFKIKNVSESTYKFEFRDMQELRFVPRVGHLYSRTEKTIIAAFRTKHHILMKDKEIVLTITEISIHKGHTLPFPWDERQNTNLAVFKSLTTEDSAEMEQIPSLADAVFESNEPPNDIIGEASVISLVVNAQCGYANYFCEFRELYFPRTTLLTVSSQILRVENRSKVNLEVNWTVTNMLDGNDSEPTPSLFDKMIASEPELPRLKSQVFDRTFSIEPEVCSISPETEHQFVISFAPTENRIHECCLKANMSNLEPETTDLEISLRGETQEFPYMLSSSYMEDFDSSDCRFNTYCGLVTDHNSKVLNFLSLGVGSECNRTVLVLNNTDSPISFVWRKLRTDQNKPSIFHCEFNKGYILPGKTTKTNFVFIPKNRGLFTDCFQFEPSDSCMSKSSLLLQGVCRDPRVFFEHACLTLGSILLNDRTEKEIILRNDEDIKIYYSFKKYSLFSDNQQVLNISPMTGLMDSKSENRIRISIRTSKDGEAIFSPKCIVQYMSNPIHFNVLMNVVSISAKLFYYDREVSLVEVKPNETFQLNLGMIMPHKREKIQFELKNTSSVGFYYSWLIEDKQLKTRIKFNQRKGYLRSSEVAVLTASLVAIRRCLLKDILLKLRILYGPSYIFRIDASTQKPLYTFSFLKYDFGKCLIQEELTKFYHAQLVFTNNNEWPVILECVRNNVQEFLIDFKSAEVGSKKSRTIDIFFSPGQQQIYAAHVTFLVNSNEFIVKLSGEGVPIELEVVSLNETFLDFGKVRVGTTVQKSVKILNAGKSCVDVIFGVLSKLPLIKKKIEKAEVEFSIEQAKNTSDLVETETKSMIKGQKKATGADKESRSTYSKEQKSTLKKNSQDESNTTEYNRSVNSKDIKPMLKSGGKDNAKNQSTSKNFIKKSLEKIHTDSEMMMVNSKEQLDKFIEESIEISPKTFVKIPPKKTVDVIIKYKPKEAKEKFESKIFFQVQNFKNPILTITGSAVNADYKLNKDNINFGNVVVGYSAEESIILINDGFVGGKFRWYLEKNSSYVNFIGGDGYSPPNSKVTTNIIFRPGHVQCVFKFKAYCQVENYKKRLELILTGGSINLPPPLGTIYFTTAVREESIQEIEFKNETKEAWYSEPVFSGSYFSGEHILRVPKESTVMYQISYAPMKMFPSQHKGTLFFPIPNGLNRLYNLEGTVSSPNAVSEISREICCKTYHSEILKIENWLGLKQQLKVVTEVLDGSSSRMIYKITSNDHFEVPPYGKRDFKWTIYVVNEGKLTFKVTFLNEKTKEFLYYVIILNVAPLDAGIEKIEFVTCVRVPAIKKIVVVNPLPEAVKYSISSSSPYVFMENSVVVLPYEKYELVVQYIPVKVESSAALLTISNPSVGSYCYNLILEAQPPNSEPEVKFLCQFGQSMCQKIPLPRLLQNSEVVAKILDNTSFEVGRIQISNNPHAEVYYHPSDIGINRTVLQITSCLGDYTFPLVGESLYPEPQGPITLNIGESINIQILNPFKDDMIFFYRVDNSLFQVKPTEDKIKAKKSMKIQISFPGKGPSKIGSNFSITPRIETGKIGLTTAKLTVSCESYDVKWIYYLQCNTSNK